MIGMLGRRKCAVGEFGVLPLADTLEACQLRCSTCLMCALSSSLKALNWLGKARTIVPNKLGEGEMSKIRSNYGN